MDGNRRWAKSRGLPAFEGHRQGANKVRQIAKWCKNNNIEVLTLYAFSTENWNRSDQEVNFLMKLFDRFLDKETAELQKENIRLMIIGRREKLPEALQQKIEKAESATRNNSAGTLILAVSYGGRDEIVRAISKAVLNGGLTEEKISACLDTADLPDPDLIIRTGGEMRISNFLIWQAAYSELYFTEKCWPDFSENDLKEALAEYERRQRRFGR